MGAQPILELNANRNSLINRRCEWTLSLNNLFISVICDKIFYMFQKESTEIQKHSKFCWLFYLNKKRVCSFFVAFCLHQSRI